MLITRQELRFLGDRPWEKLFGLLKVDWIGKALWDDPKPQIYARLPKTLEVMESVIETNRRFEAYQVEVTAIAQLGISFHDWLRLAPVEVKPDKADLMYIIPSKPLELAAA